MCNTCIGPHLSNVSCFPFVFVSNFIKNLKFQKEKKNQPYLNALVISLAQTPTSHGDSTSRFRIVPLYCQINNLMSITGLFPLVGQKGLNFCAYYIDALASFMFLPAVESALVCTLTSIASS